MPSLNINGLLRGLEHVARHRTVRQKMDTVISWKEMMATLGGDLKFKLVIGLYPADFHVILDQDDQGNTYGVVTFGEAGLNWVEVEGFRLIQNTIHSKMFYRAEDICAVALAYMVLFEAMSDIKTVIMESSLDNSL